MLLTQPDPQWAHTIIVSADMPLPWVLRSLLAGISVAMLGFGCAKAADTLRPPLDSIEQRVQPCSACHGSEGRATREGYYPRIAGKPAGYLFNQLINFRDGRRHFPMMVYLADRQNDDYLAEMARYFSAQRVPYPPPQPSVVSRVVLERGRLLVMDGDTRLHVPACRSCHGSRLSGVAPSVPGLVGVSLDYLVAQLSAWRSGTRAALAPDCMAEIVHRMSLEDVNAATAWIAMQAVPEPAQPDPAFDHPPLLKCGSISPADPAR
jgi:cytochrome c553